MDYAGYSPKRHNLRAEDDLMRRRLLAAMIAALFAGQAPTAVCSAGVLTYSWSGELRLNVASVDPWSLGATGRPFALSVSVQDNAADTLQLNTEFAGFAIQSARFAIDGVVAEYIGDGAIDLTDNYNGAYDILAFDGTFRLLGQAFDIGAGVTLPMNTFSFASLVEPPPFFVPTTNALRTTFSPPGPYTGVVESGVPVVVVPEPAVALACY